MTITASPLLVGIFFVAQGLFIGFLLAVFLYHTVQFILDRLKHRKWVRVSRDKEQHVLMAVGRLLNMVESEASEENIARAQGSLLQKYKDM